jgi:hypothetical protein
MEKGRNLMPSMSWDEDVMPLPKPRLVSPTATAHVVFKEVLHARWSPVHQGIEEQPPRPAASIPCTSCTLMGRNAFVPPHVLMGRNAFVPLLMGRNAFVSLHVLMGRNAFVPLHVLMGRNAFVPLHVLMGRNAFVPLHVLMLHTNRHDKRMANSYIHICKIHVVANICMYMCIDCKSWHAVIIIIIIIITIIIIICFILDTDYYIKLCMQKS